MGQTLKSFPKSWGPSNDPSSRTTSKTQLDRLPRLRHTLPPPSAPIASHSKFHLLFRFAQLSIRAPLSCGKVNPRGDDRVGEASVDVAAWLHGLGLQQYEQAFRDNAIDAAILPELTSEDLRDIGVNLVGHRRKLLGAIAALSSGGGANPVSAAPVVERRLLTVMFCDLVGSTALSVRRDPEDLRDLIAAYHRAVADVVKRFEGFVARYMGDGILIYFGYPRAHEDDAERASRCALGIVEAISGLNLAEALQARIGIATGMVVVGGGASEHDVVGETPNLAARLQTLANPTPC